MQPLVPLGSELTDEERRRYHRQLLLPGIGVEGQRRLKQSRVLCIGAGGLGSPVLMYLASAGVGHLGIIDDDVVDESNLQRQVIHTSAAIGQPKALSATDRLRALNPLIDIAPMTLRLTADNALALFAEYDLVVDATDNFATRYLINDACVLLGIPYVWGSVHRFEGQVAVFNADDGPCYRCAFPSPPPPEFAPSCATGGVLGAVCATIGAAQATEVIKLLTGVGDPLVGRLLVVDALAVEQRVIPIAKDPDCAMCGTNATVHSLIDYEAFCRTAAPSISAAELADWLRERESGQRDFLLVDVREPAEFELERIPGSLSVPMSELLNGRALAALPHNRTLLLHCQVGVRSLQCVHLLRDAGFADVLHVDGGLDAWTATHGRLSP